MTVTIMEQWEDMYSLHSIRRSHQRSIPALIIDLLIKHGAVQHDHLGAEIYFFDKKAWKAMGHEAGRQVVSFLREIYSDMCVVISNDGAVITVEHRYKRIRHN